MKAPTELAGPAGLARTGVRSTVRDMTRIRTIAATLGKSSRPTPLVLGGRDAAATADALAGELGLNLYRVDLSKVVSKYVGETEKNLARLFAEADARGAILVLDEADALFGKRTGVKDAHDRYSNAEINALLSGLRRHQGLVVFVSKARAAIPTRLRHHFSFYDFPPVDAR